MPQSGLLARRPGVLAVLLALLVSAFSAAPVFAHTALVGADPADGASVSTMPERLTLTFSEDLQQLGSTAELAGPQGPVAADVSLSGAQLIATIPPDAVAPAGAYTLTYRVTSADGHPVSGQVRFTTEADRAQPTAASSEPTADSTAAESSAASESTATLNDPPVAADTTNDGNSAVWIGLGVLVVVAALGGGFAWWRSRSR